VDILGFLTSIKIFDLLVFFLCFGMFVLGFIQGTIRRVLGIASMLFSFLFAMNLRSSLGSYLAANWNQFPDEYAVMLGFLIVFVAATIAFTLIIQGFYHRQALFKKATFADEVIGGILGVIQALLLVLCVIVILDSFFRNPGLPQTDGELLFLRQAWEQINVSATAGVFRSAIIPAFLSVFGFLTPQDIKNFYIALIR
jgi:uncharacterized membrane protein required for colicin V production